MAPSPSAVKRALGSTELPDSDISPMIQTASRLYENRIDGESVDADTKDDVVTRLAAHLIATGPERQVSSATEGDGQVSFEGETGEGLMATTHGQMAVMLDPTGQLDDSEGSDHFTLST